METVVMGRVIADHPQGWMNYVRKVEELLMRGMDADDRKAAMKAYIGGIKATDFVKELEGDE